MSFHIIGGSGKTLFVILNIEIIIIIIMLRSICKNLLFNLQTLKNYTYSRPEEINWLKNKFYSNPKYLDKLDYLSKLEKEKGLRNFYENKSIDLLNQEEIYYLFNSDMDYKIDERARVELMSKIKSTFFKCLLAKEFRWCNEVEQCLIVINFNQEIFDMLPNQITFCLEIISQFEVIQEEIDKNRLLSKLLKFIEGKQHCYQLILITGYLLEMNINFPELLNKDNFEKWIKYNDNFDFRAIYFLHKIAEKLNYPLSQIQKDTLNKHMKEAIQKLEINYFQNDYLVFLLRFYPEYVKILNILHFTPRAYQGYLEFYKQNQSIKIMEHKIPNSVIERTSAYTFKTIIDYRMILSLDNILTLAKNLPHFFAHSLKAVNGFINYLKDNKITDKEVEFYLEKAIEQKLKLNQEFTLELTQNYSVNQMLNLFSLLNKYKLCSISFWKKAVKMLEKMIELSKHTKIIESKNENYVNLLQIVTIKNFKEETREIIYQELIALLNNSKNQWNTKLLLKLSRILASNKIGQDQIWLLIEKKIMRYIHNQRSHVIGQTLREHLSKLIVNFNSLDKGSYKFWHQMNQVLDSKTKKDILNRIKEPTSLAHTNLFVKEQKS